MKRFLTVFIIMALALAFFLCGCGEEEVDRSQELKDTMSQCDAAWDESFPSDSESEISFTKIADHIAVWCANNGLEVTEKADHYVVLTNSATKGKKDAPSFTICCPVDPAELDDTKSQLSLAMTGVLGPKDHGRLRLIVTESLDGEYPGAEQLDSKYKDCDHFIYLYKGGSDSVYTAGPLSSECRLSCDSDRTEPSYTNAYKITVSIPDHLDPYTYDKEKTLPNPINVLGDLLASAKSSGRLFEIASFSSKQTDEFLPRKASVTVVIDSNNVEAFQKRFDKSFDAFEDRFGELEQEENEDGTPAETFTYTMEETDMPDSVLGQSACDNIISLMYTLQTGIHLQDEESNAINAASYIRSVRTKDGKFSLVMDMRSRDSESMEEMSGNYLITSGLCDVKYKSEDARRLWSSAKDSSLAAWFLAAAKGSDSDAETIRLQSSECDVLYKDSDKVDMVAYRYDSNLRDAALTNLIDYATSISAMN